jgi:hypothetical protein
MNYLVVSYSLAPLNAISSLRTNGIVRFLCREGHQVTVLTSVKSSVDGGLDSIEEWEEIASIADVHEVQFLRRRRGGYQLTEKASRTSSVARRFNVRRTMKACKEAFSRVLGALFDYRTIWAVRAISYFDRNLSHRPFDVIVTTSGPVAVNFVGAAIKRRAPTVFWIADFRDMWSLLHTSQASGATRSVERWLERRLLSTADLITTVSEFLVTQMGQLHSRAIALVRNGFDPEVVEGVSANRAVLDSAAPGKSFHLVYAGTIYRGRRDPFPLLESIVRAQLSDKIAVHFIGPHMAGLDDRCRTAGLYDFCIFHGQRAHRDVLSLQKAADANIFLESPSPDAEGVLTGKLFELIGLQKPILAIGPPEHFESVRTIAASGLLLHWPRFSQDPAALFEAISSCMPQHNYIESLQRERQFKAFLPCLKVRSPGEQND